MRSTDQHRHRVFGDPTSSRGSTAFGNRWDLLPSPSALPSVSVVIPYFEQQGELERVLVGLSCQRGLAEPLEVIVADDGSATSPVIPNGLPMTVTVVRQEDRGVRPAAARNLGAAAATGDVLVFLDGDTVPAPDAIARLAALPSVASEMLVVGRREYCDFTGWTTERVARWLADSTDAGPPRFPQPSWLEEAYERTADLRDIDERSYQLVIGAIMSTSRSWFERIGGFDETIDCYGGEDWELAYRSVAAGSLLAHVRDAVGYHHGPDWRGRQGAFATKNPERLALARTVPGPDDAITGPVAQMLTTVGFAGPDDVTLMTIASLLRSGGSRVRIDVPHASPAVRAAVAHEGRVLTDGPTRFLRERTLVEVEVCAPLHFSGGSVTGLLDLVGPPDGGRADIVDDEGVILRVTATRALNRASRWTSVDGSFAKTLAEMFEVSTVPSTDLGIERIGAAARNDLATVFPR